MTLFRSGLAAQVLLVLIAQVAKTQGPPSREPRVLPAPTIVYEHAPRSPVPQLLELATGDLIVSGGGRVTLLDPALRPKRALIEPPAPAPGARGSTPLNLKLFRYRGDSIVISDGTPAMALFGPSADSSRTMAFGRTPDIGRLTIAGAPRLDAQGRFVYTSATALVLPRGNGSLQPDTVALLAFDQRTRRLDTLTFVRTGTSVRMTMLREGGRTIGSAVTYPFNMDDHWAVLSDGTVMIVRALGCIAEVVTPTGLRRITPAIPCDRRRVSQAEKDSIFASLSVQAGRSAAMLSTSRFATTPVSEYPDYAPAYRGAIADNEGRLWLSRNTTGRVGPSYDVIDKDAKLVDRVVLPVGTQLLGFGKQGLYVFIPGVGSGPGGGPPFPATATIGLIPK